MTIDDLEIQVDSLENKIDLLNDTFVGCTKDIIILLKLQNDLISEMSEALALAKSPTKKDLETYSALREAFDKYDFVRKLTLGEKDV
jgi:hypothetical protein